MSASSLLGQDASMFRGNLAHTGVYQSAAPRTLDVIKWKFQAGAYLLSSPAVVGNLVYIGSTDGRLYALDRESGEKRWALRTGARVVSSPAVADGRVYVLSYDDTLYAANAETGAAVWKFATQGEHRYTATHLHGTLPRAESMPDPYDTFLSSPAVWNSTVYFGSSDGHVYALDATTGKLRWKFKTGDVVHSSPAVVDGTLFIGGWDTYFYALDAKTGALRWKYKAGDDPNEHNQVGFQSSPAVVDGVVYVGGRDSYLYALRATTGALVWRRHNRGAWVIGSPAVTDGKVYYGNADGQTFYVLDAATGTPHDSLKASWYFFASPAVAGPMVYAPNWDGRIFVFDRVSRQQTYVFETDSSRVNRHRFVTPEGRHFFGGALPNGREYFYDQHVIALANEWTMGSFLASPVVAGGVVYCASMDGTLYALTARNP
jgi:outer membrane protein assembly factor BamB